MSHIYISYSHRDKHEEWFIRLIEHFKSVEMPFWIDTNIRGGRKWRDEIVTAIKEASMYVLIITPSFLTSRFINEDELPLIKENQNHRIIFPILAKNCAYDIRYPWLADYQRANNNPLETLGESLDTHLKKLTEELYDLKIQQDKQPEEQLKKTTETSLHEQYFGATNETLKNERRNSDPQKSKLLFIIASIIVPVLSIIIAAITPYMSYFFKQPKFCIANSILKSDTKLIIRASNKKANKNKKLNILFDGYSFPNSGIIDKTNSQGMNEWNFEINKHTDAEKLVKDGEHKIKVCFPGDKYSEEFNILFLSKPPIVRVVKTKKLGQTIVKGEVTTEVQVPKNILSVYVTYYQDGKEYNIDNIPLTTKLHKETGITYFEFETVLQGLPVLKSNDPNFSKKFWSIKVIDQAGNKYYYDQSYAKFMAPGSENFGVGIANIKIEKLSDDATKKLKNIIRIIPHQNIIDKLPNGKSPIDLTVNSIGDNAAKLEWKYNMTSLSPLTLVYKNDKKIGASITSEYFDYSVSKDAKYRVEQKSDQIIYKSNIGNIENKYEQKYFALVIGNSKYNSLFLKNPVNDARDLSHILMKKGFSVILRLNTTRKEMIDAIRKFGKASGVGLFYFAGLGVQMNGKLFIVPIDAQVHSEPDIKYECISLDFISDDLNKNRVKPYNGQLFAYSTSSDQTAHEGERNGIYTKHLLKNLIINGLEIHQMFRNVREAVEKETKGRQTPQELSTAKKSFYFTPLYKNDFEGSFFIFILDTQRNNPYSRYR